MKMTIDRIEGSVAVLLSRENESMMVTVPVSLLPEGSKGGDSITLMIEKDLPGTREAKDRVSSLIEKLRKKGDD